MKGYTMGIHRTETIIVESKEKLSKAQQEILRHLGQHKEVSFIQFEMKCASNNIEYAYYTKKEGGAYYHCKDPHPRAVSALYNKGILIPTYIEKRPTISGFGGKWVKMSREIKIHWALGTLPSNYSTNIGYALAPNIDIRRTVTTKIKIRTVKRKRGQD